MSILSVPIPIQVKDKVIYLEEDNIKVYQHQVDLINKSAYKKTEHQWIFSNHGIKIPLDSTQQGDIITVKDQIVHFLSPTKDPGEILSQRRGFSFSTHAFERALTRVERVSQEELLTLGSNYSYIINPETLEKIVNSLVDSKKVDIYAEWKAHPYLNFKFICSFDNRTLEIVVNFQLGILIVTMIISKETGYFVREVYTFENGNPIKKPSPYK